MAHSQRELNNKDGLAFSKKNPKVNSVVATDKTPAKSKLLIANTTDLHSITDHEGSFPPQNVLDKELNLTEYEQNIRAAHGFPNSGSALDDGNENHSFTNSVERPKAGSLMSEAAPQFGLDSADKVKHSSTKLSKISRA